MGGGASICGNSHVSKTVTCRSWVGSSTDGSLVFPEAGAGDFGIPSLQAKPDFAICMSGGNIPNSIEIRNTVPYAASI